MPSLSEYGHMLANKKCDCGRALAELPIENYDHPGGWRVEGIEKRQWLSVVCPECNYGISLYKVGIPGRANAAESKVEERRFYPEQPSSGEVLTSAQAYRLMNGLEAGDPTSETSDLFQRLKIDAREIDFFVSEHVMQHSDSLNLSDKQQGACRDAARLLVSMVVMGTEIDTEQMDHFANWFVDHVIKFGMSPMDYMVFATYLNTAGFRDRSLYPKD
ncbi:MAG: hypothetical protein JWO43_610 [Candidatus Adlerbacteria bacterium]|nr:hypothetical protein [Candidatus Adlerbacteria bacterium]